ncbi:HDIG domain-containing metalloprotein [uncultured Maribacter sp.]|uniref:HD family phosphohydrolase n=1 Tax=uncultured Maribacter sp. TaxID=431308 RepID=UPI0026289B3F|nr:HDIG domain-containing metalloprotein [uncultured Maribacter sp.]
MRKSLDNIYKNQSHIYKYGLYIVSICFIVFFFPKGGKFKYEYQKGKPWQFENLYAPFDFSVNKTDTEIAREKKEIIESQIPYYRVRKAIEKSVSKEYVNSFLTVFDKDNYNREQRITLDEVGREILKVLYRKGLSSGKDVKENTSLIYIVKNNSAQQIEVENLPSILQLKERINKVLSEKGLLSFEPSYFALFEKIVQPNIFYDQELSNRALEDALSKISYTRGAIEQGDIIISKGEVVKADKIKVLDSLKAQYESELWSDSNYYYIIIGYVVLVALVLMMLLLFIRKYRSSIFENSTKVTFIFFNILLFVFITTLMLQYEEAYVFVVPLCILPLILKTFFDSRLALIVHVLTVLLLGFIVPNSFEYLFLQIIAGVVTILTVSELYKRANLFISIGQITLIYILGYLAFHVIHEGNLNNLDWITLSLFLLNGMITTVFVQPLIYIYEKVFGLVSDVSLLELSDTNSKLLKELSNKAPGTFHHSLQVSNLAEAAANEIGANAMLVRVGALYHDIGKMANPTFFTENQITNANPHDELEPKDSAKIIIDHVINGIEIARKNKLPDRVIDFIRSHHGVTLVYYFYKKHLDLHGEADEKDFRYPGPLPFSKETAILMMADSVEAASKSLKNPTYVIIDEFVDKIIAGQVNANQFLNANITFKEIEIIKKVMKQKLRNIYHLRVEYPE